MLPYVYIIIPLTLTNTGETIFVLADTPDTCSNVIGVRPSPYTDRREETGKVIGCDNFKHYFCYEEQAIN
jgi:hypothetical protein